MIIDDSIHEYDEHLYVRLSNSSGATINTDLGTVTNQDDDGPEISINGVTVDEADGAATLAVTLSSPSQLVVSALFQTEDFDAVAGEDYQAASGAVTFLAGEWDKPIEITILDDSSDEYDEHFYGVLRNALGATISVDRGSVTIRDDDDPTSGSTPELVIDTVTVDESAGTATFTVTMSAATAGVVTVDYVTADGSAAAGQDYGAASGTVTFQLGEAQQTFSVSIADDSVAEADETFSVGLSNASGATIGTASGVATIHDDDGSGGGGGGGGSTNDPPVASDDGTYQVLHDTTLTVNAAAGLLTNDSDADVNDQLTVVSNTAPSHGSVSVNPDGSFSYTPSPGFVGQDSFSYTVSDGTDQATATATINVTNSAPTAQADGPYTVLHDTTLSVAAAGLLANDSDPDANDPLTVAAVIARAARNTATHHAHPILDFLFRLPTGTRRRRLNLFSDTRAALRPSTAVCRAGAHMT